MKTYVIIPTYNEAESIAQLVEKIRQQDLEVLVVDDGSSDNTSQVAKDSQAKVLRNTKNMGKGASLIRAFKYIRDQDFDALITMDGDGQHAPEDIPSFIRAATNSDSGIFIGNRMFQTKDMPWVRLLTNRFMSWIISVVARQKIPDSQCGFRLIKKEVLKKISLETSKYEIESEIIIKGARCGFKIESVTIGTIYNNRKSRINPFIDTVRFLRFIIRQIWNTRC